MFYKPTVLCLLNCIVETIQVTEDRKDYIFPISGSTGHKGTFHMILSSDFKDPKKKPLKTYFYILISSLTNGCELGTQVKNTHVPQMASEVFSNTNEYDIRNALQQFHHAAEKYEGSHYELW